MEQPPAIPPSFLPQAAAKKGMPALAWVGIGCGGLLLIALALGVYGFIVAKKKIDEFAANPEKAAAEMVISMTPDFEKLSQDDAKGTMTIRTKGGEEMTLSYKDIAEGKFTVTDKGGNTTMIGSSELSHVPAWVPKPADFTEGLSVFHSEAGNEISGQFSGKSALKADDLISFFESEATKLGFPTASGTRKVLDGVTIITHGFTSDDRSLHIVITEKPGSATLVNTNYSEKK